MALNPSDDKVREQARLLKATGRRDGFRSKWDLISDAERARLDATPTEPGMVCVLCEEPLETEGQFARHFHVPDPRLKNTGYCPEGERGLEMMARRVIFPDKTVAVTYDAD